MDPAPWKNGDGRNERPPEKRKLLSGVELSACEKLGSPFVILPIT